MDVKVFCVRVIVLCLRFLTVPVILGQVNLLRSANHGNLVRLLGYCQDVKKVLIYEFAEEGTLWDHLHGQIYL